MILDILTRVCKPSIITVLPCNSYNIVIYIVVIIIRSMMNCFNSAVILFLMLLYYFWKCKYKSITKVIEVEISRFGYNCRNYINMIYLQQVKIFLWAAHLCPLVISQYLRAFVLVLILFLWTQPCRQTVAQTVPKSLRNRNRENMIGRRHEKAR